MEDKDNKFINSIKRYRNRLQELHQNQRVTKLLGIEFEERLDRGGKRLRVSVKEEAAVDLTLDTSDEEDNKDRPVLTYPKGSGGITLYDHDLAVLDEGKFLNDNVINVILTWYYYHELSSATQAIMRICDCHMYSQLVRDADGEENATTLQAKFR